MSLTVTAAQARRLILFLQGLGEAPGRRSQAELLALIERLGYVQLDSIDRLARAHHMILRSRDSGYRPAALHRLQTDRLIFENWTHDAAVIPMAFYPYWRRRFREQAAALAKRWRRWRGRQYEALLDDVRERVRQDGEVMARDFAHTRVRRAGGAFWDWHGGKTALEYLWRTGELAITRREGFQKVYDLAERVIPEHLRNAEPGAQATVDWACAAALERLGLATPGQMAGFWGGLSAAETKAWCRAAVAEGRAEVVQLEGVDGSLQSLFAPAGIAELLAKVPDPPRRLRLLNPFDPVLRDRRRLARVFGFDYRIEIFVPEAERRYGYYVFPLLEGERLVGRIDLVAQRQADALAVRALWLEPGIRFGRGRQRRLEAELERWRRFAGLGSVTWTDGVVKGEG
ncbi:MAG TPA: crosslink repair DNA glycosylase YcaQ family protein [Alphaproteobacteria bacterium]|nr:crosslink repair DNA glycosylase YcaQ family protein [Alphaproteobacteria bacterium]MDP7163892.1 crosslink repair DNA glycosylase YcaQ family protein [Alphaproteobacteria bacterium]MDP7429144.1 crosslink repair DNA glycosylase YcaQ family protein [Alphaproteobacteria bacterium]HJM49068.1 crosslink repair DNA glycosylase YcaQ family protein [Alphaproteobacteria bacterium]